MFYPIPLFCLLIFFSVWLSLDIKLSQVKSHSVSPTVLCGNIAELDGFLSVSEAFDVSFQVSLGDSSLLQKFCMY